MTEAEAKVLAAKREAHKSKHLAHKRWEAVHNSTKGWHVTLVDVPQRQSAPPQGEVGNALDLLMILAHARLMDKVRQTLGEE